MRNDLQQLAVEQQELLDEASRRLAIRDGIDERRRVAQRQAQRDRLEKATHFRS